MPLITTQPGGRREYRINDHLGSSRVVLNDAGLIASTVDYAPFGGTVAMTGADVRKTFIDKELDQESKTYNTGVRQYEPSTGFTSIDPLWEKFRAHTPYHYSYNNPLGIKDPSGLQGEKPTNGGGAGFPGNPPPAREGFWSPRPFIRGIGRFLRNLFGSNSGSAPASGTAGSAGTGASKGNGKDGNTGSQYAPKGPDGKPTPLPKDKHGNLVPDSEHPHTQIGTKEGRNGSYKQTIEFGKDGKPIKRTDWTDHGYPKEHTNPHDHPAKPAQPGVTPTRVGGTFEWGGAEPLINGPN